MSPLRSLPARALPARALLGALVLATGCVAPTYSVQGEFAPQRGLNNESSMAEPLRQSYPSAMKLGQVLLVVPYGQDGDWQPGKPRYLAVEGLLATHGATLKTCVSGDLPPDEILATADLNSCPTVLNLSAFRWEGESSRYFVESSNPTFLTEASRETFDALPPGAPRWRLLLDSGIGNRLTVRGSLQVEHEGKRATHAIFQFRLSLAHMPYPEGYGAVVEGDEGDLSLVSESARVEVFGPQAVENAETYALANLLRFANQGPR